MKQIRKKILPKYFNEVWIGNKSLELRKDEDDVQVGDELILDEYSPEYGYTGMFVKEKLPMSCGTCLNTD